MKGAGVGMTKAFKQIGGVALETDEVDVPDNLTNSLKLKINIIKAQFNRSEQRQKFREKMNQSQKVQTKLAEIATFANKPVVEEF